MKDKKYINLSAVVIVLLLAILFPMTVFANSSWHWITETRPADILPFVIAGTLLIETIAIRFIPKVKNISKIFVVVSVANLVSFLMPYIWAMFDPDEIYTMYQMLERTPFYTVGFVFLFMTIVSELPIVYFSLRKETENKDFLLITIIGINILTTIIVAIVERTLCYGQW